MNIDPTQFYNILAGLAVWGIVFIGVFWLSLVIWTLRDIRARSRHFFNRFLAVLVVLGLFLPGLVIYLILRPRHTLEEAYQQTLEEEALLQTIEESPVCPGCSRRIKDLWVVCPSCHTKLRKKCDQCGQLMELSWNVCPYCGWMVGGLRQEDVALDDVQPWAFTPSEEIEPLFDGDVSVVETGFTE